MSINAGDAVLRFLGDSTQLDSKFKELPEKTKEAFRKASDEVQDNTQKMGFSMKEARGEARLLGEELGIRLPRHVSNFLAEMPGIGPALSAAFSATAVLILAKAVVETSQKVTDFVTKNFIYTEAMKESEKATADTNKELVALSANYDAAKKALDTFGATGTDSIRLQVAALQKQIATTKLSFDEGQKNIDQSKQQTHEYLQQTGWLEKIWDKGVSIVKGTKTQVEALHATTVEAQNKYIVDNAQLKTLTEQLALLDQQLETEHKIAQIKQGGEEKSSDLKAKAAQASAEVALDSQTATKRKAIAEQLENDLYKVKRAGMAQELAILKEHDANTLDQQKALLAKMREAEAEQAKVVADRLKAEKDELLRSLQDIQKTVLTIAPDIQIITPSFVQNILNGINAAHNMGVTLRQDLVKAFEDAKKAEQDFVASGIQDTVARKALAQDVDHARQALENYGQAEDKFKIKSHGLWSEFRTEVKDGATAMDQAKQLGMQAFDDLGKGLQAAIATAILAQGSFTQALEKATASALASIASQALVKALFYTGEGFAALAGFEETSASQYFAAAGVMAAVGAAAGLAAHALSGAGGGSNNTQQSHTSESNTGQSNRSGGSASGVQAFATGGLITGPTLGLLGEDRNAPTEAVLPLDNPEAMKKIGGAIGKSGAGGDTHFHIQGLVSSDHLVKIMGQMSKLVKGGKAELHASNSLRVTKRSA